MNVFKDNWENLYSVSPSGFVRESGELGKVSQSSGTDVGFIFLPLNVPWALDRDRRLDW